MARFESAKQYREFSQYVMNTARHVLDAKNRQFIEAVVETSYKRKVTISGNTSLWRAQIGNIERVDIEECDDGDQIHRKVALPYTLERMIPYRDRAIEGRVNPKGIPCLYCATDIETAIYEVRPWSGSYVTVAEFVTHHDLTLADCTKRPTSGAERFDKREALIWLRINLSFSQPVSRFDGVAEYAPTQVLAEAFRLAGYDGIKYSSSRKSGENIAIFSVLSATPTKCRLYKVNKVEISFSEETEDGSDL